MFKIIISLLITLLITTQAYSEPQKRSSISTSSAALKSQHASLKQEIIKKAQEYKENINQVISLLEVEVKREEERLEKKKLQVAKTGTGQREVEKAEESLRLIRAKIEQERKKIADTDKLIQEVKAEKPSASKSVTPARKTKPATKKKAKKPAPLCKGCYKV